VAPRREHSRKPEVVHERIERLVEGPYLELFARASRPGWDAWGNQSGLFDDGTVATRRMPSRLSDPAARTRRGRPPRARGGDSPADDR
jgi:hypothetical protein